MKFLFIFPPGKGFKLADEKICPTSAYCPPLGILYLSKILETRGHIVEVLDFTVRQINETKFRDRINSADAVGLSIDTGSRNQSMKISKFIKEHDNDLPLIIGGPHCTLFPESSLIDFNANICVKGRGELVIDLIAEALDGKRKLSTIPGIYYWKNDKLKKSKSTKNIKNLDELSFPARHLVDEYNYGYFAGEKLTNGKTTAIITTRGCPYNCSFCGIKAIVPTYQERSTKNVLDELDEIISQGYRSVFIVDNNFLANNKRAETIIEGIIQREMSIDLWIMGVRVDSAKREIWEKMREAGVKFLSFGIESGNQDVLDFYNKKTSLKQIKKAIYLSKEMDFITSGSFIIGAPIETRKHIENTIKLARSLPLDVAHFMILAYIHGSPLWKKAVLEKKIPSNIYGLNADSKRDLGIFSEKELKEYCRRAYRSFYLNPKFIWRHLKYSYKNKDLRYVKIGFNMFKIQES